MRRPCRRRLTYRHSAEHHGCGTLPARVGRPKDKSLAEGTANIVEQWAMAPSHEMCFRDLAEFGECLDDRVAWPNAREMEDQGVSRDERPAEELPHLLPLPAERHELCEWGRAKVAPDYHVRVDYMHYSVPFALVGRTVDVGVTDRSAHVMDGGEVVAEHRRPLGRKGRYATDEAHMPPAHRGARNPWSRGRFEPWADRMGLCIRRVLDSRAIVGQAFVLCRNTLGLSKPHSPELLERACGRFREGPAAPSYTAPKDVIAAMGRGTPGRGPWARRPPRTVRRPSSTGPSPPDARGAPTRGSEVGGMLAEEDFAKSAAFRVRAPGQRLREMCGDEAYDSWTLGEKVREMIDAGDAAGQARRVAELMREARFREPAACVEDVVYMPERKLSRDRVARLAGCPWVEGDEVLVIISKTGCGKSFLAQALGAAACGRLLAARHVRLAGLCGELDRARAAAGGSHWRLIDRSKSIRPLIINDFLTTPMGTANAVDLFEILEARRANLIASQLEPDERYLRIEGELVAGSILGRVASACRYLDIDGPNMRKWLAGNRPKEG